MQEKFFEMFPLSIARAVQDGVKDQWCAAPGEGRSTPRHFVEHRAEAEQVRARVQLFTPRLLRRHIGRSALRHSGAGEVCGIDLGGWRIL